MSSYISYSIIAVGRTIIAISSIIILYIVVHKRKRHEFIYIATICAFLISGLIGSPVGAIIVWNAFELDEDPV